MTTGSDIVPPWETITSYNPMKHRGAGGLSTLVITLSQFVISVVGRGNSYNNSISANLPGNLSYDGNTGCIESAWITEQSGRGVVASPREIPDDTA